MNKLTGTVYLSIEKNYNLNAQIKIFESICYYLGLMENNIPDEEIHQSEHNLYYFNKSKINTLVLKQMFLVMQELDIKIIKP